METVIELTNEELDLVAGGQSMNPGGPPPTSGGTTTFTFSFSAGASGPNIASVSTSFNQSTTPLGGSSVGSVSATAG